MRLKRNALIVSSVLACASISGEAFAQAADGYVATGTQCQDVFVKTKGGLKFSPRVDVFAPAFIVKGKTLSTPTATCSLRRTSSTGDVRALEFECRSSVSYAPVKVYFRKAEDGSLIRQASASDTMGSRYERCSR